MVRGSFHACYLGYSIGQKWQGQGLMFEALTAAIRYMQRTQHIHRIMANYMPHNQRSGDLLARLGFEKEGYAKDYLLIDGEWRDHVLTALTTRKTGPPIVEDNTIKGTRNEDGSLRAGIARDRLPAGKTGHHAGAISALCQRRGHRLQPENQPRAGDEPQRT